MAEETDQSTLPLGSLLHWYEVQAVLGRGGYGVTYLALDRNLHRKVAIKEYLPSDFAQRVNDNTVHPKTHGHQDLFNWGLERFLSEARTLAQFNHKAIIKVNSVFEQNNTAYMVMEYEEGEDLAIAYEKYAPFSQQDLLKLFLPITQGLALVHNAGFIHRDIKPANIYVRHDGTSVLLDFGSARQTLKSQTNALTTLVTTGYAPFEQYNQSDDEQGVWTDIYALGSTLYSCITGSKPVDALKRSASLIKSGRDVYEPISNVEVPGFSKNFLRAIDHALMFHPERRPHSVLYWADMLSGKVDVAPVTDDLFTIKHPGDEYYDLDSTVVMTPVRAKPAVEPEYVVEEPTVVNNKTTTGQSFQPAVSQPQQPASEALHKVSEAEQDYVVEEPTVVNNNTGGQSFQPAVHAAHIQPVTSDQLDKITEALSRKADENAAPLQQKSPGALNLVVEELKERAGELWEKLLDMASRLKEQLPGRLENSLQNKTAVYAAGSITAIIAVAILVSVISGAEEQDGLVAQSESAVVENSRAKANQAQERNTSEENITSPENNSQPLFDGDVVDSAKDRLITALLDKAQQNKEAGQYVEANDAGAYYHYKKILDLEPGHLGAAQEITNIENYYTDLVTNNITEQDWQQAETNFSKLKIVSTDTQLLAKLQEQFNRRNSKLKNVDKILKKADALLEKNKLTKPKSNNALALYNKVLAMDPDNPQAKDGIDKIVAKLGEHLKKQLTLDSVKSAELTFKKIETIDPNAPLLLELEPEINKLLTQRKEVFRLLRQAKADFIRGNIIHPVGNNALSKYRSVIKIDPGHRQAKEGIETIYQYYVSDFNRYLQEGRFDKADRILGKLSDADFARNKISQLKRRLEKQKSANNS